MDAESARFEAVLCATVLDWAARAKACLDALPEDPIRDMLSDIADYVVARLN